MLQLYDIIPFHLVFLVPILQIVGGGMPTLMVMVYAIAADSVKSEHRYVSECMSMNSTLTCL